jgi:trans-aconitate 2-methyltransferase
MAWDPDIYLSFAGPRFRPVIDLLQRIDHAAPNRVIDLGCGTGNATPLMRRRWPEARITGVDGSPDMLARAREAHPDVEWVEADIADWAPDEPADVVFSNAALHWLDDHERLFPRLVGMVAPGGQLAVQMPRNYEEPGLALVNETALDGPWCDRLEPVVRPVPVHEPTVYYRLLRPLVADLDIWESVFIHVLEGENPVADWTKGAWMSPLLAALDEPERTAYEAEYRRRVAALYPKEPDGTTLFPFRRVFLVATV